MIRQSFFKSAKRNKIKSEFATAPLCPSNDSSGAKQNKIKSEKRKILSQTGQTVVETLGLSLALTALVYLSWLLFWMGINILWIEHQLYQGLLCAAQHKEESLCKKTTLKQIKRLTVLGSVSLLKIKGYQKEWEGEILWRFQNINFLIRQNLSLPR